MLLIPKASHLKVTYEVIVEATSNLKTQIGSGGYGHVYKGKLTVSGELTTVAVKKLDPKRGQGNKEFLNEIHLLSRYKHQNLVSLVGFCDEGIERFLIYKYAERGSLDKYLKPDNRCPLTWRQRINICIDAARGLNYLHNPLLRNDQRVIHRDIKSANILLDSNWKAIIADLGLSIIGRANESTTFLITGPCGTAGYVDPDFVRTCFLTTECDVYSFGVVLLEVLCGMPCILYKNGKQELLVTRAKDHYEKGKLNFIIDPRLKNYMRSESIVQFSEIAIECLQDQRTQRPSMSSVLRKLERALTLLEIEEARELLELEEALDLKELVETLQMQDFVEANGNITFISKLVSSHELDGAIQLRELVETSQMQKTLQMQDLEEAPEKHFDDKDRIEQTKDNRLPSDYKQFLYYSNEEMMKKPLGDVIFPLEEEAYSTLSNGVLIKLNNEFNIWFWITKLKGKKCFVLPPTLLHRDNQLHKIKAIPSKESRTENVLHLSPSEVTMRFDVPNTLFSKNTTYGCFLVYKILQHFDALTLVETRLNDNLQLGKYRTHLDISESPVNEFKPVKREDGWLEVNLVNKSDNIPWIQQDEQQYELSNYFRPREKRTWKWWCFTCISHNEAHNDTYSSASFHYFKKITIRMNCIQENILTPEIIVQGIEFRPIQNP